LSGSQRRRELVHGLRCNLETSHHDFAWPRGEEVQIFGKKRLSDLAEAGGLFAALGGLHHGYGDESASGYRRDRVGPVDIDVDVNVEAIGSGEL
ncbi:hypothetical protein LTR66_013906, partial [Elasticomyces elasticus]